MPDRDPALEAAFEAWMRALTPDGPDDEPMSMTRESFYGGYAAALRSLGAGTPEAQQALRELVRSVTVDKTDQEAADRVLGAAASFAALATPTEEGK